MCSVSHIVSVALDFRIRTTHVDDTTIKLQIWNTAGQERFKTITSSDFDGVHGIIIVYDITNPSFENVERIWLREIECFVGDEVSKLLAGNKCDLEMERQVSYEAGKLCADLAGIPFLETSAKDATNIERCLLILAESIKNGLPSQAPCVVVRNQNDQLQVELLMQTG